MHDHFLGSFCWSLRVLLRSLAYCCCSWASSSASFWFWLRYSPFSLESSSFCSSRLVVSMMSRSCSSLSRSPSYSFSSSYCSLIRFKYNSHKQ